MPNNNNAPNIQSQVPVQPAASGIPESGDRVLWLIRGLPNSGQYLMAQLIANARYDITEQDVATYTPTDYLPKKFSSASMVEAHAACFEAVKETLENDASDVIVYSVFSQPWEMEKYADAARENGYKVFVLHTQNDYRISDESPVEDRVPQASLERSARRWVTLFTHEWLRLPKPEPRRPRGTAKSGGTGSAVAEQTV